MFFYVSFVLLSQKKRIFKDIRPIATQSWHTANENPVNSIKNE